jgi:hypothetical protein
LIKNVRLLPEICHARQREGGPNNLLGNVFNSDFIIGPDPLLAEDIEPGVAPEHEHTDEPAVYFAFLLQHFDNLSRKKRFRGLGCEMTGSF